MRESATAQDGAPNPTGRLLDGLEGLSTDDLPGHLAEVAAEVGLTDLTLRLADLQEQDLVVWPEGDPDPVAIDGTVPGRAFQRGEPVKTEDGTWWFPLGDGSQRLGVMGVRSAVDDDTTRREAKRLAGLCGLLLLSRSAYSDSVFVRRRRRPITIPAELRWSLMPPRVMSTHRVTVAGLLEPAYEIAGDSFDYALNGDRLHVAVFDAMGHGLTASRLANLAVTSYRHSRRGGLDLLDTYRAMDRVVAEAFGEEMFVTGHFAELDLTSGRLSVLNAGHPHALVIRGGAAHPLSFDPATPIGLGYVEAEIAETRLEPDDAVLIHSDGVVEARAAGGEIFGVDRLGDLAVRALAGGESIPETVRRLVHSVMDHRGMDLEDDATLLMFCRHQI
ncbi:MAG TPA: PP2C family protein-serine/threonine phosphatase [Acidimicrobiales bacterium]|nr:PP2C family protein-serine/threonine phosphatase [Acidimicrobiales bacterium]